MFELHIHPAARLAFLAFGFITVAIAAAPLWRAAARIVGA